jgi:hypothetical protein
LATVSAATAAQPPSATGFPPGVSPREFGPCLAILSHTHRKEAPEQPPAPPPTLDEIDVTRHREITSKAVSAILLLTLKWFKVSREYSLCLAIDVRSSFGLTFRLNRRYEVSSPWPVAPRHKLPALDSQDVWIAGGVYLGRFEGGLARKQVGSCVFKCDHAFMKTSYSFFRYCQLHFGPSASSREREADFVITRKNIVRSTILPNGQKHEEEIELLTDFSWRNFFATINFAKIMQKLSKHRSHRIWMLVQYKSSVGSINKGQGRFF